MSLLRVKAGWKEREKIAVWLCRYSAPVVLLLSPVFTERELATTHLNIALGSVAKICSGRIWRRAKVRAQRELGGEAEELADKPGLGEGIPLRNPSGLSFADHVHRFGALQGSPRTVEGAIAPGQPYPLFRNPVVLLNQVIEKLALSEATAAA